MAADIVDPFDSPETRQVPIEEGAPLSQIGGVVDPFDNPETRALPERVPQPSQEGQIIRGTAEDIGRAIYNAPGNIATWARKAYTGEDIMGEDLPEFRVDSVPGLHATTRAKIRFGLTAAIDPENRAAVIRNNIPEAKTYQDEKGNWIVDINGQRSYVNRPGLTQGDIKQFAGQTLAYIPSMTVGRGDRAAKRMTKVGGASAGTSVAVDLAGTAAGSEEWVDPDRALFVGLTAGALEGAAPWVVAKLNRVRNNNRLYNYRTQKLTPEGEQLARDQGLDPAQMEASIARQFAEEAQYATDPSSAGRNARANEFDIPLTQGQAARDFDQLTKEEIMRHGSFGEGAGSVMRDFDAHQAAQIQAANQKIQGGFSGGTAQVAKESEAGGIIGEGVKRRYQEVRQEVDDAYAEIASAEAFQLNTQARSHMHEVLSEELNELVIDEKLTPASVAALDFLGQYLPPNGVSGQISPFVKPAQGSTPPLDIEIARRRLNAYIEAATNPADKRAAIKIRDAFDEWVESSIENGYLSSGTPEGAKKAVETAKQARAARRKQGELFEPQNKHDSGGKAIDKIVNGDLTDEQVVNTLIGKGRVGSKPDAAKNVARAKQVLGADSAEFNAIRELVWMRITQSGGKASSPQKQAKEIARAIDENESLLAELYTPQELGVIKRYREALEQTITPEGATNPSKTAYQLANIVRYLLRRAGTAQTFQGNPTGGAILHSISRMPGINRKGAARNALRPLPIERPKTPLTGAAGTAYGATQTNPGMASDNPPSRP